MTRITASLLFAAAMCFCLPPKAAALTNNLALTPQIFTKGRQGSIFAVVDANRNSTLAKKKKEGSRQYQDVGLEKSSERSGGYGLGTDSIQKRMYWLL